MESHHEWKRDLRIVPIDPELLPRFGCGREEQNEYLRDAAVRDQRLQIAMTRLFLVRRELAAFVTTMVEAVELGTREKDPGIRYRSLPAMKIAQLGVDRRFAGQGLGQLIIGWSIQNARLVGAVAGLRYVTLDAKPDVEPWYARHGFIRNKVVQKRREEGRPGVALPVSMRFDLLRR
jgi:GNAT superfamily N-acetyltransferase